MLLPIQAHRMRFIKSPTLRKAIVCLFDRDLYFVLEISKLSLDQYCYLLVLFIPLNTFSEIVPFDVDNIVKLKVKIGYLV